jgi:hypothetical protein
LTTETVFYFSFKQTSRIIDTFIVCSFISRILIKFSCGTTVNIALSRKTVDIRNPITRTTTSNNWFATTDTRCNNVSDVCDNVHSRIEHANISSTSTIQSVAKSTPATISSIWAKCIKRVKRITFICVSNKFASFILSTVKVLSAVFRIWVNFFFKAQE